MQINERWVDKANGVVGLLAWGVIWTVVGVELANNRAHPAIVAALAVGCITYVVGLIRWLQKGAPLVRWPLLLKLLQLLLLSVVIGAFLWRTGKHWFG